MGGKAFVTGFALSGAIGEYVDSSSAALEKIQKLIKDPNVGLIVISDEIARPIKDEILAIKTKMAIPLIYEVPGPGSRLEKVEYRAMLRTMLGV